jgi:hypothetical protein
MTNNVTAHSYRLPVVTAFSPLYPHARARARDGAYTPKRGNQVVTSNSPAPSLNVTILRHGRCIDCRKWTDHPYNQCQEGLVCNGVLPRQKWDKDPAEWHYCAFYNGPQISRDIFLWKTTQGGESHANQ